MAIYLDHAATTPLHPEVLQAMIPYYTEHFGNPSSIHGYGRASRTALDRSRAAVSAAIGCSPADLLFTSGGTESNNTALYGIVKSHKEQRPHMITTVIEHHAVLHPAGRLEKMGCDVTYLPVDMTGLIRVEDIERAIRPETVLISVMYVNNEIGTIQPIEEIGRLARSRGIAFHVDAVQALGKIRIDLSKLQVDLMSFSAHKINGPKGVGALYYDSRHLHLTPQILGGSQERRQRAGTENVAGIVGFAKSLEIYNKMSDNYKELAIGCRSSMDAVFHEELGPEGFVVNGNPEHGVPHIYNVSFPGVHTETLLMSLDLEGIAAASGSACSSGSLELSHVLRAMQLPESVSGSAVRFSFGLGNSIDQIQTAARTTATIVKRLRK
ncbi:cysteine desulfurase family protein [Paenibacillus lutrae]|uniref:cysteine desulfurase n=1 Tax=Paenibacillus lutrae TaxID=2078573 RepID=A0A7X3FHB8_9BACL|nr:cysteine desulfurase family protein [Paenibacillus lutrae]MVO99621.1 aminotransferase class V-fold PLP-dependent enzyme [Paenibacillus lutrae]